MVIPFECEAVIDDLTESLAWPLREELAELCCYALGQESAEGPWSVTIAFTSDEHMAELHETFMGISGSTDILSFPFGDELGGDIAISVAQAERQRHDDHWELADELRFLVAHGALHLAGWDDQTPEDRAAMLDRQRAIIAAFQGSSSSRR